MICFKCKKDIDAAVELEACYHCYIEWLQTDDPEERDWTQDR